MKRGVMLTQTQTTANSAITVTSNLLNPVVILEDCMAGDARKRKVDQDWGTVEEKRKKPNESSQIGHDWCSALLCPNNSLRSPKLTFFAFPRDSERCMAWVRNAGRDDLLTKSADYLNKNASLCAVHFEIDQFINPIAKRRLVWDAVPTVFKGGSSLSLTKPKNMAQSPQRQNLRASMKVYQGKATSTPRLIEYGESSPDLLPVSPIRKEEHIQVRRPGRPAKRLASFERETSSSVVAVDGALQSLSHYLPESTLALLKMHLQRQGGRDRWTKSGKRLAIILYVHFYRQYIAIRRWFDLPSVKRLAKWLSAEQFLPGIHTNHVRMLHDLDIFERCKDSSKRLQKKAAVLVMTTIKLKPSLTYNAVHDRVEGLEDLEFVGRTRYLATRAVVLVAKGLMTDWSLPLGHYPVSKHVTTALLAKLVFETLYQLESTGLHVRLLVCSNSATNRALLEYFAVSLARPYIYFMGRKVMVMYDPPELLKTLAYNFQRSDLSIGEKNRLASWKHVEKLFALDSAMTYPLMPELTSKHMELTSYAKYKTRMAADVFQYKIAAGLSLGSNIGNLPKEASVTAEFVSLIADVYDCFCGTKRRAPNHRPTLCSMTDSSPHTKILTQLMSKIRHWSYVGGAELKPCLEAWHLTVTALVQLWFDTQRFPRNRTLKTKNLRLKNLAMRNELKKISNTKPVTAEECRKMIQQLSIDTLLKPAKLRCLKLEKIFFPKVVMRLATELDSVSTPPRKETSGPKKICAFPQLNLQSYVAGHLVSTLFERHKCTTCRDHWIRKMSITVGAIELYILWMEKLLGTTFQAENIVVPSDLLIDLLGKCEGIFMDSFARVIHMDRPMLRLVTLLRKTLKTSMATMCPAMKTMFLKHYVRYRITQAISVFNLKPKKTKTKLTKRCFVNKLTDL